MTSPWATDLPPARTEAEFDRRLEIELAAVAKIAASVPPGQRMSADFFIALSQLAGTIINYPTETSGIWEMLQETCPATAALLKEFFAS